METRKFGIIINQYKRICTINARKINPDFAWQSRFYDHVIRNDESLVKIRLYIKDNPEKWAKDQLNPNNDRIYPNSNNK